MATKKAKAAKSKKSARKGSAGKGKQSRKGATKGSGKKGKVKSRLPPPSPSTEYEAPIDVPGNEGMRGW